MASQQKWRSYFDVEKIQGLHNAAKTCYNLHRVKTICNQRNRLDKLDDKLQVCGRAAGRCYVLDDIRMSHQTNTLQVPTENKSIKILATDNAICVFVRYVYDISWQVCALLFGVSISVPFPFNLI